MARLDPMWWVAWAGCRLADPSAGPSASPTGSPGVQPSGNGGGGFEWDRVRPDPTAVPRSELFYSIVNACMFLGVVAALAGMAAGAIAFGVGPIFGAHIISDRGKAMMWKAALVAIVIGSLTSIVAFLLKQ